MHDSTDRNIKTTKAIASIVSKKTGELRVTLHRATFVDPYVQWPINLTSSECVSVALGTQRAISTRHVILPSVAFLTLPHFLLYVRHEKIKKERKEQINCVNF
jgi:hypothetical protein